MRLAVIVDEGCANLRRELVGRLAHHGSTFSRVGASDQPGAVQFRAAGALHLPETISTTRATSTALERPISRDNLRGA
jgi:hypothetical protein